MLNNNSQLSASTGNSGSDRRLDRASRHVNDLWFPPNPKLLERIREGLEQGVYDLDVNFLFAEVKTDFALLTYCLREISTLLKADQVGLPEKCSFLRIFEIAGLPRLKSILSVGSERISTHSIEDTSEEQALRLQEAMISASTVEVLALNRNMDSDFGFSCALMRQLGHTLISWNYPSVYQRCLSLLGKNKDLDTLLTEALGFSPLLLAVSLATQWGLDREMQAVLQDARTSGAPHPGAGEVSASMIKMCQIGEALARANDPEHYPSAEKDWLQVRTELESSIGLEGIKTIQEKVRQNCESYLALMPEMFSACQNIQPDALIHDFMEETLLKNNPFVKHCPPRLRKKLKDLYSSVTAGNINNAALQKLIREIIPFAGFNGGYIYTLDPGQLSLMPRTKIGAHVARTMNAVKYDTSAGFSDPIAAAFSCSAPIVENSGMNDTAETSYITASIGSSKKIGVLYLELAGDLLDGPDTNMLLHFKAVRQALNDCLQI